jgi:hypothetical protein
LKDVGAINYTAYFRYPRKVNHSPITPMVALPDYISMSAEEYLVWEPTQEQRYEYWDGEVVAMSGGTRWKTGSLVAPRL